MRRAGPPTVTKTVASVTPGTAKGTFVVAYDVTVSNPSTTTEVSYDLTDAPAFPAQVTISEPKASVVRSNLDGSGAGASTAIEGWVSGGPLATGKALPAGKKDTYRVSVLATVPREYSDDGARVFRVYVGAAASSTRPG